MARQVRHTTKYNDNASTETLLAGEVVYTDSNTIKIGDGQHVFSQLPEFSSNESIGDGATIVINNAKKIQAHGTLNKNPNATGNISNVFDWIGTQQEFVDQNIETLHPEWLCFVTDDLSGTMSGAYTSEEIDAFLSTKANGVGDAILTTGNQTIEGTKTFLNGNIRAKSGSIDHTQNPESNLYLTVAMAQDKNNQRIGILENCQTPDGSIGLTIGATMGVDGQNVYGPPIGSWISKDGSRKWTSAPTPSSVTANDTQIATTAHVINVLKTIYPVGSIYLGTQNTCPMASFFGTWTLVSSGRALWTGNGTNGNTTIAAGLPNITGTFTNQVNISKFGLNTSGAIVFSNIGEDQKGATGNDMHAYIANFNASSSSTIYGNSTTVQPPAYVVNAWRRTA